MSTQLNYTTAEVNALLASIGNVAPTAVDGATYQILATDNYLQVTRTTAGVCSITFPASADIYDGYHVHVKDSGYNCNTYNITMIPDGSDKIENAAANYTISADGTALSFMWNDTTGNWEAY